MNTAHIEWVACLGFDDIDNSMGAPGTSIPITAVPRYQGTTAQGTNGDVSLSNANE